MSNETTIIRRLKEHKRNIIIFMLATSNFLKNQNLNEIKVFRI
jgi:hypothetical protein